LAAATTATYTVAVATADRTDYAFCTATAADTDQSFHTANAAGMVPAANAAAGNTSRTGCVRTKYGGYTAAFCPNAHAVHKRRS